MTSVKEMSVAFRIGVILGAWGIIFLKWTLDLSLLQIGIGLTFVTVLFLIRDSYRLDLDNERD